MTYTTFEQKIRMAMDASYEVELCHIRHKDFTASQGKVIDSLTWEARANCEKALRATLDRILDSFQDVDEVNITLVKAYLTGAKSGFHIKRYQAGREREFLRHNAQTARAKIAAAKAREYGAIVEILTRMIHDMELLEILL